MRIVFDKQGRNFIEVNQSSNGKISIILSSYDVTNPRSTIINSVELTSDQLMSLLEDVSLETNRKERQNG